MIFSTKKQFYEVILYSEMDSVVPCSFQADDPEAKSTARETMEMSETACGIVT